MQKNTITWAPIPAEDRSVATAEEIEMGFVGLDDHGEVVDPRLATLAIIVKVAQHVKDSQPVRYVATINAHHRDGRRALHELSDLHPRLEDVRAWAQSWVGSVRLWLATNRTPDDPH